MYDVDYETKDYVNAIKTINKLIPLTLNLKIWPRYMSTSQFDKALSYQWTQSIWGNQNGVLQMQILSQGNIKTQITNLIDQIQKFPKRNPTTFHSIYLLKNNENR
jgi:hypothetical protein